MIATTVTFKQSERLTARTPITIERTDEISSPAGVVLSTLEDTALVAHAVSGVTAAFDELVHRYRNRVLRLVSGTLSRSIEVEDIAQEIFIKAYLSLPRYRGTASFSTWLYTIAVNRCRDEIRRSRIRRFLSFDDWFGGAEEKLASDDEDGLELNERARAVRTAMKHLPASTQMLLHLREIEEMPYKELADVFDVEIGTIKSRLARAREKLRSELLPYLTDGTMPDES